MSEERRTFHTEVTRYIDAGGSGEGCGGERVVGWPTSMRRAHAGQMIRHKGADG